MLDVRVTDDEIRFGEGVQICFERTLRIPDAGRTYPRPPGLERFPVFRVEDYAARVPAAWREHGGVFLPMYQREAMWISFSGRWWKPNAVKVGVGEIDALTGQAWDERLTQRPQNYVVVPDQPWLAGIRAGDGSVRQLVPMPLGMGHAVKGQISGREEFGGLQMIVFEPKPGRFPDKEPGERYLQTDVCYGLAPGAPRGVHLAAAGRTRQKIYPDDYGIDAWDAGNWGRIFVHIANTMTFREITGQEPPLTPVTARDYTEAGLPWFDLYDEGRGHTPPSETLKGVKSVKEMDEATCA